MSPHLYSEDQLIEQPAIALFADLRWGTVCAMEETFGTPTRPVYSRAPSPGVPGEGSGIVSLGRETKGEVVLVARLRAALEKLNPDMPAEAIATAIEELTRDRSAMSPEAANREIYLLMKDGIKVSVPEDDHPSPQPSPHAGRGSHKPNLPSPYLRGGVSEGQKMERVRVVDWENPDINNFLLVSQFSVTGELYTCRPDLVGFVNGLPWVVIELKKPSVPARAAFDDNLTHYKQAIPKLFWYSAFLIASNGTDSRIGSITADWERFFEWKRVASEVEPKRVSLEVMIRGTCDRARLLDLVENFTLFSEHKAGLVKIVGQNHQFLGVNNAIHSMLEAREKGHGRAGVFWQTQGSGKSFSMVFFAQKVLRKIPGNWTFVIVTDRVELDDQIAKTFKAAGAVTEAEGEQCHAKSGAHLRQLLRGNHRYVFTLIHKFQATEMLCDRPDVIVMTDEAHRSQYDTLALNMRSALPKALFLAFTGTPLIAGEERTKEVFGEYVSIYDFQQSVEDGATVPLYYENRTPELQLVNPDLNDDIYSLIEAAELDEEEEAKLEKRIGRQYHILTRDDRLETIAQDIVTHFLGRGFMGKAMVVSIDKATALKMHDKVRRHWTAETKRVKKELGRADLDEGKREELVHRLDVLQSTDMALIVSAGQNEIADMEKHGLDIRPHRKRMVESQPPLDEKFKDTDDPLRLVFLCAMWLTGFDVPSCSTVYLDKPMRNHTLMQTIARANRVFPGKYSGVIVDYANVFASLERALAIYGAGTGGENPVCDKQKLVEDLRKAMDEATVFCAEKGVMLQAIEALQVRSIERLHKVDQAVNALVTPDPLRREFLGQERIVSRLYKAVKPDPVALEFAARASCLAAIADAVRGKLQPSESDLSKVMGEVADLLDESITGVNMPDKPAAAINLSKIDFESLRRKFEKSREKSTDLEVLKAAIRSRMERLISMNRTRTDFRVKFEELLESYNAGSRNIDELFEELMQFARSLGEEETRHIREQMTEEELVIFDILTRPAPELSPEERAEIKKVARELLEKIRVILILNWRQKSAARSQLKLTIEDVLDTGLPRVYSPELYKQKCSAIFQHVYESYPEKDVGVYAVAG